MKKAKQTFEKMTKYSIRKLSVSVGPVAIGVFLLGGSLLGARPVKNRSGDSTLYVHLGYVTEEELTAEEKSTGDSCNPWSISKWRYSISSIRRREATQIRFFLKRKSGSRSFWVKSSTASLCGILFTSKAPRGYGRPFDWAMGQVFYFQLKSQPTKSRVLRAP